MNISRRHRRNTHRLDGNTAERMFDGLAADDAPPDYAAVAAVLAAASAPADEWATGPGEYAAVRAYHEAIRAGGPARSERQFQPWRTAAGRIAIFATAGALTISGGVAAAATGSLPAPAQRVAHQILGGLGVPADVIPDAIPATLNLPRGGTDAPTAPDVPTRQVTRTPKPPATGVIHAPAAAVPGPRPAAAPGPTATTTPTTDADGYGKAVPSIAKSAPRGPDHGAEAPIVGSDDACTTPDPRELHTARDHRRDHGTEKPTNKHRGNTATPNVANGHRTGNDAARSNRRDHGTEKPTNKHRGNSGTPNVANGHRTGNDAVCGRRHDHSTAEPGASAH